MILSQGLGAWEHDGEILCRFAAWRNSGKNAFSDQPWRDLETRLASFRSLHFADENIQLAPKSQVVAELFYWIGDRLKLMFWFA